MLLKDFGVYKTQVVCVFIRMAGSQLKTPVACSGCPDTKVYSV